MANSSSTRSHDRTIVLSCIAGVLISTYALYVELVKEAHPEYRPFCDIGEHASCSKVLTSEYSKGFGVIPSDSKLHLPNCVYGVVFYCLVIFLKSCLTTAKYVGSSGWLPPTFDNILVVRLQLIVGVTSVLTCFYLAYLLAFVLHDFCLVCVSTYIVNGFMTYFIYKKTNALNAKNK